MPPVTVPATPPRPVPPVTGLGGPDFPARAAKKEGAARSGSKTPEAHGRGEVTPCASGSQPREWTLEMPAGMRLLSLNDRRHWAEKGRITRDLRNAAWAISRQAKIPALERAKVTVTYHPPLLTRRRDLDNVGPASGKPCIDGALRDAKVLADDSPEYLTEVTYRIGEPYPKGRLVLVITEVLP